MEDYRKISYIEEDCREGLLFKAWTEKWGLKVQPWYEMDLLKFSFIEKGANGKGKSFDVSVPTKKNYAFDFEDFCHEIIHDIPTPYDFVETLAMEKEAGEKYPKRYCFITGSNGEKSVGFCNSTIGEYCINAQSVKDGRKVYANIPLSYYDIYEIAASFMETYQSRRRVLKVLREQGMKREIPSSKRSSDANESDVEYKDEIMEVLHVSTASKLVEQSDGDYMINAKTDDGRAIGIRIPASAIETMNKINPNCFRQFSKRSSEETISFFFSGKHRRDNRDEYIFQKFVKPMLT